MTAKVKEQLVHTGREQRPGNNLRKHFTDLKGCHSETKHSPKSYPIHHRDAEPQVTCFVLFFFFYFAYKILLCLLYGNGRHLAFSGTRRRLSLPSRLKDPGP